MMPPVVIIAGGVATRLRPITETIPKSMVMVAGKPFIDHQLRLLQKNGIKEVVICSGFLSEKIEEFVGDGSKYGLSVKFSVDGEKLLGTGGAVKKALPLLGEEFFVVYGDSYPTVDFKQVYDHFLAHPGMALMTVFKNYDAWDRSNIVLKDGMIITYDKKNKAEGMDYIDYGLGLLKRSAFSIADTEEVFDLAELYQDIVSKKQMSCYEVAERFYEIGSLGGLTDTEKYILNLKEQGGQTPMSVEKNVGFFLDEHQYYRAQIGSIDTYAAISSALSRKLQGMQRLLDIGNGGVFDYDTSVAGEIIGLDLFLDKLPSDIRFPSNIKMVQGNALDIPKDLNDFDGTVIVMLIHHLVGRTVNDCIANTRQLLAEARRVLRPGGKLIIMESCVPTWFFAFEKIVFRPATWVIERAIKHPATLQYSPEFLFDMIEQAGFSEVKKEIIPKGKYVLQYGFKVPSWATPVQPVLFSAVRPL